MSGLSLTQSDFTELSTIVFQSLYEPDIPIPALMRESTSYPTIFQNLLASKIYPQPPQFSVPLGSNILENLFSCLDMIRDELKCPEAIQFLISFRWVGSTKKMKEKG